MDEAGVWATLKKGMDGRWLADRIESGITGDGIPDVHFCMPGMPKGFMGWIELKYLAAFPKRPTTTIKIRHFIDAQKLWLTNHGRVAGNCWLFIRIENEFFLFPWTAVYEVEQWTRGQWQSFSAGYWKNRIDWPELHKILREGC